VRVSWDYRPPPGLAAARRLEQRGRAPNQSRLYKQLKAASCQVHRLHARAGELRHTGHRVRLLTLELQ
jgi:hypothetical protein